LISAKKHINRIGRAVATRQQQQNNNNNNNNNNGRRRQRRETSMRLQATREQAP
jgi:hypothetical protein